MLLKPFTTTEVSLLTVLQARNTNSGSSLGHILCRDSKENLLDSRSSYMPWLVATSYSNLCFHCHMASFPISWKDKLSCFSPSFIFLFSFLFWLLEAKEGKGRKGSVSVCVILWIEIGVSPTCKICIQLQSSNPFHRLRPTHSGTSVISIPSLS